MVVLHERADDAVLAIPFGVIGLEKESTTVFMDVGLDREHARQDGGGYDAHVSLRARAGGTGTGRRRWTPWRARAARDRPRHGVQRLRPVPVPPARARRLT